MEFTKTLTSYIKVFLFIIISKIIQQLYQRLYMYQRFLFIIER